jgi:RNase P/RNase MRP subunit p30
MDFTDLNLRNIALADFEKSLGFAQVFSFPVFSINSQNDLSKISVPTVVESASLEFLMSAAKKENTVMANPFLVRGFEREPKFFRRIAEERGVIEIPMAMFLQVDGARRASRINIARKTVLMARKFKATVALTSRASEENGCKSPEELMAFANAFLGMNKDEAAMAVSVNPANGI